MALLDETDIEILHSLQKDAKINAKELSEKLHISKTPIYERIKRLENEGYIKGLRAGRTSTFGKHAGMERQSLWPVSPDGPTAIPTSTQKRNSS